VLFFTRNKAHNERYVRITPVDYDCDMNDFCENMFGNQIVKIVLVFLALISCGYGNSSEPGKLKPVKLQLKWTHAFQFAGYYMAAHNGYYRDAGLAVEIIEGGPNLDVTEEVLSGRADFGVGTSGLLLEHAAGKPVRVLGVIYQHSPAALIMRADKTTSTMQDLIGKTIMIESYAADVFAMFKRVGVPVASLNCIHHTGDAEDLLKYDAYAIFAYLTNEPYVLDQLRVPYIILSPRTYGIDFYGDNFFTSRKKLAAHPEQVAAFCAATVRGWQAALDDPEKAVDLILAQYPTAMSRDHLLFEAARTTELMTQLVTPGYMLRGRWEHIADTYIEIGMLAARPDLDDFLVLPESSDLPLWLSYLLWCAGVLVAALLAVAIYLKMHNYTLQRKVLKQQEDEKAQVLQERLSRLKLQELLIRDIHDGLGGIATSLALTAVLAGKETEMDRKDAWLRKIEQLAAEANSEVRDLISSLDAGSMRWAELVAAVRRSAEILFSNKETQILFHCDGIPLTEEIGLIEGLSLTRILREGLNNVLRHSGAERVEISLTADAECFQIAMTDNGCGFDPQTVRRGRGLNNMKERTAELNGSFEISVDTHATRLDMRIPRPLRIAAAESHRNEGERR